MSEEIESQKALYVLHTYAGYENKVKQNLESRAESMGMEENIIQVMIPEQRVYEQTDEGTEVKMEKTFPGYVLVEMVMSDEAWYVVRNTPNVPGFGSSYGTGSRMCN